MLPESTSSSGVSGFCLSFATKDWTEEQLLLDVCVCVCVCVYVSIIEVKAKSEEMLGKY